MYFLLALVLILLVNLKLTSTINITIGDNKTDFRNATNTETNEVKGLLQAVFWEVKPFLFTDADGNLDGIIPTMFSNGEMYCKNRSLNDMFVNYAGKQKSRKLFYELLRSNIEYRENELQNITKENAIWIPSLANTEKSAQDYARNRRLTNFQLFKSKNIAVIIPRSLIALPHKMLRGLYGCQQIFVIAILLSIFFGVIVWSAERQSNREFPMPFYKGIATGIWWAIVSMSTVGYGDVVPRSVIGRSIAFFWLIIGVVVACLLTATVTDFVSGVSDLSVYGRSVSVLEKSVDEKVAAKDYGADVVPAESYEEVIELVRNGTVFAAMINEDVAAWYQKEIVDNSKFNPLRIVQLLPANLYVNCIMSIDIPQNVKDILNCMYKAREEVYDRPVEVFRRYCHTETIYIGSISDLFGQNVYLQVLLGIVCSMIFVGVNFDLYVYFLKKKNFKDDAFSPDEVYLTSLNGKDTAH